MPWGNSYLNRRSIGLYRSDPTGSGPFTGRELPDGVQIKPLDAATINMLKGMGVRLPVQQTAPAQPAERVYPKEQKTPFYTDTNIFTASLRERIQDERNSSRFYAHLAEHAPRRDYADYFSSESGNCGERANRLCQLYERYAGASFGPLETDVNTRIAFAAGVNWAAAVECRALEKFAALYENAPDERCARGLFTYVCGKLSHMMMLILIMLNKEVTV